MVDGASFDTNAYEVAQTATDSRAEIMDAIAEAIDQTGDGDEVSYEIELEGKTIDISTGAGALVLDDTLSELSNLEEVAAQITAAEKEGRQIISKYS